MVPLIHMSVSLPILHHLHNSLISTEKLFFIQISLFSSIFCGQLVLSEPLEKRKFDLVGMRE